VAGRTYGKVEQVAGELAELGGHALAVHCDVADRSSIAALVERSVAQWGRIDILINNAHAYRVPEEMSIGRAPEHVQALEDITDADLYGTFAGAAAMLHCMQACFPYLKERGGAVINMGSPVSIYGEPLHGSYTMTKEAIGGLTKVAAAEWGQYQIRVNTVAPAAMSPAAAESQRTRPDRFARIIEQIPLGRIGDCDNDVGRAIAALVGPDMRYLTGATIVLDGGRIRLR
jgi:NAD(P)-dependent dehydrogenase (short-subunit alcohol dehydrogenase family)